MYRTRPPRKIEPPDEGLLFARAEQDAASAAVELIGSCWPNPLEAVAIAESEGVCAGMFSDDLLILWLTLEVAGKYRDTDRRRLAKRCLRANFHWDDAAPAVEFGRNGWSDATLAILAESHFHSDQLVRLHARALLKIRIAQRDAAEHLKHARRLLMEAA